MKIQLIPITSIWSQKVDAHHLTDTEMNFSQVKG